MIGGDGLADDYEVLSRGVPIFRILKATGRCPKNGNAGTATSIRKTTGESKQSSNLDLIRVSIAFARHRSTMMDSLIIFHCPETGTDVQTLLLKQEHEEARPYYVAVTCPACTRLHFLDKSTGMALGPDE